MSIEIQMDIYVGFNVWPYALKTHMASVYV